MSLDKSLPLIDLNRPVPTQPEPNTPAEVHSRLERFLTQAREHIAGFTPIDDSDQADPDTALSKTQLLSLLIGFVGCDTTEALDNRTYTLVYTDPEQGKSNYQTICIPDYRQASPVLFTREGGNRARLTLRSTGETLAEVLVHARLFGASSHYYSRVSPDFVELPTATIISPYSTCAGGCLGCSRGAVKSFTPPPKDYIEQHVAGLAADYDQRGWDRGELVSVNITTGCQPDEVRELEMMVQLMQTYRRYGFANAAFHAFTYAIDSAKAMEILREHGAIGFIGTIETFNDAERIRQ
ncbi:hypothetical protein FHX42_002648 [Saccharopolyspora lacisalsi]|uniref:Radical SAM protein n=1 Tax=Halosaccharopolyspora lacisalsi TaxID=1000566 RepID=A0A839E0N2_9PSEU|nr:hypothetical protein [Halosaccharopolyspora lacisalsi]MBA8825297.1 hypothetical protein [Halosaccharopolyspora lacisalsi]